MTNNIQDSEIRLRDGFPGEIMHVVPRPFLENVSNHPLVNPLTPTDIGWFPAAKYHYRARSEACMEHILIFCTDGQGWYNVAGNQQALNPYDAVIIPRDTPHAYGSSDELPWTIHWVHFIGSVGDYYVQGFQHENHKLSVDKETAWQLESLFCTCRDAFEASFVLQRMVYASQALHHLLACLLFNNRAFSPLLGTSRFHNIEDTLSFMHKNVHVKITLDELAEHAGLSRSHFVRIFKEQTRFSPSDYFIRLKMQRACMLLSIPQKTVRVIGLELGYDDPCYFTRAFKKVIGISPSDYRQYYRSPEVAPER